MPLRYLCLLALARYRFHRQQIVAALLSHSIRPLDPKSVFMITAAAASTEWVSMAPNSFYVLRELSDSAIRTAAAVSSIRSTVLETIRIRVTCQLQGV